MLEPTALAEHPANRAELTAGATAGDYIWLQTQLPTLQHALQGSSIHNYVGCQGRLGVLVWAAELLSCCTQ